ncbi:MAG: DUF2461 domain-containing protein [Myxococcales bacterium]|nr:DUF2461 domain-containing protein [Myxococcales bacterium]MCB9521141.1 DUF2461 domain-containing protein [Myxococcales bacterium]MCB9530167.1 DUF2461 domain-containing protein [Myxococcales bacterium]
MFDARVRQFLIDLGLNNDRKWFEANRRRYEAELLQPALAFVRAIAPHLAELAPHFEASDKQVGGSLMRIYRDTRFAKDKTPFKTNVGIQFRHEQGRDVHAPGFYVHIDAAEVFVGVGAWHPDPPTLAAFRAAIDRDPSAWFVVRDSEPFASSFRLAGESLKRPPKGFDADHVAADDLRRKDHIAVAELKPEEIYGEAGVERVASLFRAAMPYMRFLLAAVELDA